MKKNRSEEQISELRAQLENDIASGKLPLHKAARAMRKIVGMTQTEFANLLGIAPRTYMDLESERGNPTLNTINKVGRVFGFTVGFVKLSKMRH